MGGTFEDPVNGEGKLRGEENREYLKILVLGRRGERDAAQTWCLPHDCHLTRQGEKGKPQFHNCYHGVFSS